MNKCCTERFYFQEGFSFMIYGSIDYLNAAPLRVLVESIENDAIVRLRTLKVFSRIEVEKNLSSNHLTVLHEGTISYVHVY